MKSSFPKHKIDCVRIGLYYDDYRVVIVKSPKKKVKIGLRAKIGWAITLFGVLLIFGHPKEFETVINPLFPEPPKEDIFTDSGEKREDNDKRNGDT